MKKVYSGPAFQGISEAEALLLPGDGGLQSIRKLGLYHEKNFYVL